MGGQGSGRKPSTETIIKRSQPQITPVGNSIFIPDYSGVKPEALKTSTTDIAASETDPVFMALSGSLPYIPIALSGSLNYLQSGDNVSELVNDASYLTAETDPVFMALSGSLPYAPDTTVSSQWSTSGSAIYYNDGNVGVGTASPGVKLYVAGEMHTAGAIHATGADGALYIDSRDGSGTDFAFYNPTGDDLRLYGGGDLVTIDTSGNITVSGLVDGVDVASLSGSYDAHAADASDPHGATLTQTNIVFTSGSRTGDVTISGSAYVPNILFGVDETPPAASGYSQGSVYIQYTA